MSVMINILFSNNYLHKNHILIIKSIPHRNILCTLCFSLFEVVLMSLELQFSVFLSES